jgi:predicted  nucleic acid-binding Zn-ribbon protein
LELSELEVIADQLLERQKELDALEEEINRLELDLHEFPRKSVGEKKFYALIGMNWDEPKMGKLF